MRLPQWRAPARMTFAMVFVGRSWEDLLPVGEWGGLTVRPVRDPAAL